MTVFPRKYTRQEFLKFLRKYDVNEKIITKFVELPEAVIRNGDRFVLDISSIKYSDGDTHYTFEMNYYSEELVEYLFNSKVFNDIEFSINYLICELMLRKYITYDKENE